MVRCDEKDLEVETGKELLSEYRFNTDIACHYFCKICGIYTFHRMRKLPEKYAVNAGCIESCDLSTLRPILIQGSKA